MEKGGIKINCLRTVYTRLKNLEKSKRLEIETGL